MGIVIGLGLSGMGPVAPAQAEGDHTATVAALAVPQAGNPAIFDSGAARGSNAADIPLAGTTDAPDGLAIEARLVRADTGAQVQPWQAVATASGGAWSGVYTGAARAPHRLWAEVRVAGSTDIAQGPTDIMVGHVVVLIGQSEDARMFSQGRDRRVGGSEGDGTWQTVPAFPAGADDDVFVMMFGDTGEGEGGTGTYAGNGILTVNEDTPVTASIAHLANVWARNAPGEKLLFISATQSGSNRNDLANDSDLDRDWDSSFADAVALVRAYGGDVGAVMDTWTAADGGGESFYEEFLPFYSGYLEDGSVYPIGTDNSGSTFDHLLWDLTGQNRPEAIFDPAVTRMAFHGPHRFEDFASGGLLENKQGTRTAIRELVASPLLAPVMRPKGPEILLYQNGTPTISAGSKVFDPDTNLWEDWADYSHPSDYSDDGLPGRARHTAIAALYALGRGPSASQNAHVPRLNRADWQTTHVDLWYEAPDGSTPRMSTTWIERGESAMPTTWVTGENADGSTLTARTDVMGLYLNGGPAERVEIVNDRVRVYPNGGGTFAYDDTISYGLGGASGIVNWPQDEFDDVWKSLPIAVMGFDGIDGVALEPLPDPDAIANTLPAPEMFTTRVPEGPYFDAPGNFAPGVSKLTLRIKAKLAEDHRSNLFVQAGRIDLERLSGGSPTTLSVKDSSNSSIFSGSANVNVATLMPGVWFDLVVSIDLVARTVRAWQDGALVLDLGAADVVAGSGMFDTRKPGFLKAGGDGDFPGTVERLEIWTDTTPDGDTAGLGGLIVSITGPASAANAHPWKAGGDAS